MTPKTNGRAERLAPELLVPEAEWHSCAFRFTNVPGNPPRFAETILRSIQSYYAVEELHA